MCNQFFNWHGIVLTEIPSDFCFKLSDPVSDARIFLQIWRNFVSEHFRTNTKNVSSLVQWEAGWKSIRLNPSLGWFKQNFQCEVRMIRTRSWFGLIRIYFSIDFYRIILKTFSEFIQNDSETYLGIPRNSSDLFRLKSSRKFV